MSRALTPRDRVVQLLTTLELAETAWNLGSAGDGVRGMPSMYWEGSYAELERCLDAMRDHPAWHRAWWNVMERYSRGKEVRLEVPYKRTLKGPLPQLPARHELGIVIEIASKTMLVQCYRWHENVQPRLVEAGLDRLIATMYQGDTSKVVLPREILYRALGKEPPDGKQLREGGVQGEALAVA